MEVILKYFKLSEKQADQFNRLLPLYEEWNAQINVISRKDIEHLYLHHVLHSMAIAKYIQFKPGSHIIDLGSGGGFPGIPLAILFPEVQFTLVDSIGKKLKVAQDVAEQIGLSNVDVHWGRVEEMNVKVDFIVTRAVAPVVKLVEWSMSLLESKHRHGIPNGIIALKGPTYKDEIKSLFKKDYYDSVPIHSYFKEEYFREKWVLYIQGR